MLRSVRPSAATGLPPPPARSGTSSISGTTHRSWNNKIASITRPCVVLSSSRSLSTLSTMAVDDRAANEPQSTALGHAAPPMRANPATTESVPSTCNPPPWNTVLPSLNIRDSDSSSPMVNSSKTRPSSARAATESGAWIKPRPCGPITTPVTRNPTTVGARNRSAIATTGIATATRTTRSRSI